MENQAAEFDNSILTTKMDVGTQGFDDFQAILLNKSRQCSETQKRKIDLLSIKYLMEDYVNSTSVEIRPVGDFLKAILQLLHIKQNKFAHYIGLKPSNFSKLLSGERPINYDLALIFGKLFNHNPMLWIEIQTKNEFLKLKQSGNEKYADYSLNDLISSS